MQFFAPISGLVVPLAQVPDPVFAQKMIGDGIAIDPIDNRLCAPCDGEVTQIHPAGHALTITSSTGVPILMHIGIDTVQLKGEGFTVKTKLGAHVHRGDVLIEFDTDKVAYAAKSLLTIIAVPLEGAHLSPIDHGRVKMGSAIFSVTTENLAKSVQAPASQNKIAESAKIEIHLPTGLHARPAAVLVNMAKSYGSNVQIVKDGRSANAKSLVALLGLEIGNSDQVYFCAEGEDAGKAVTELAQLLSEFREAPPVATPTAQNPTLSQEPNNFSGIAISPGLALGRVHQLRTVGFQFQERSTISISEEAERLRAASVQAERDLKELVTRVTQQTDAARAAIFTAQGELLSDPELLDDANRWLREGFTAEAAWQRAAQSQIAQLENLNNELLAARANDLRDIEHRVLLLLTGTRPASPPTLFENTILLAENLTPSETVQLDRNKIVGFCTTGGGATSHVAILARSLGLPALAGVDARALTIAEGSEVLLNADQGFLIVAPTATQRQEAQAVQRQQDEQRRLAMISTHQAALTHDGHRIEVAANIGSVADARQAAELGADGIGLLRSEFLFLERTAAPTEDEQLAVYQEIADCFPGKPVVIRTLDIGGDKPLKYLPLPQEENPFLGVRGVRVGLRHPDILRTQLRAILRVRSKALLHVMFPMISTLEEWREARTIFIEEHLQAGEPPIKLGIMVEVPSVALTADTFAQEVDFFSIGTNDLTQYTLAMDRGHKELAKQVDATHPAVLRLIEMTAQAAHRHGKWVGVCGGLASDLAAVPTLLGLGVRELSVSIPTIPLVKARVRQCTVRELETKGYTHVSRQDVVFVSAENR